MKAKHLLLCACALAMLPLAAQENLRTPASGGPEQSLANPPLVERSIEGCLSYNGVSYVLAVVGNGPKQYRVVGGDTAALHGKLGHTVQVSGMAGKNNPQEMIDNSDMRQATTGVMWETITAEKVRDVTSNCSYPGFEHPASTVQQN